MKRKYTVEILLVDPQNRSIQNALWNLLVAIDHEFVPPLSNRESTTTMTLSNSGPVAKTGPRAYFGRILTQKIVMAKIDGHWAGLLAFRHNYTLELLGACNPCNYLTTIGVSPQHRNIGIARSMYHFVLNDLPQDLQCPYWSTRTWSTNHDHLHLLHNIGFALAHQIENHRGDGIDTLYFVYQMPEQFYVLPQLREPSSMEQA